MEAVTIFSQHSCSYKFSKKNLPVKGLINVEIIAMKKPINKLKITQMQKMHYNVHVYGLNCFFLKNTTKFAELSIGLFLRLTIIISSQ